jgi:hypothetical protein
MADSMTIDDLPTFTVQMIGQDRARGTFAEKRWIGERHFGYVITSQGRFVQGRFVTVDLTLKTAAFVPEESKDLAELQPGSTYRRIDDYWGERAELVLDRQRVWTLRAFEATDAIRYEYESGHILGKAPAGATPQHGALVKGGWDHEHCRICWATISSLHDPLAMFSEPNHWLCQECYANYVVSRSLEFIVEGQ